MILCCFEAKCLTNLIGYILPCRYVVGIKTEEVRKCYSKGLCPQCSKVLIKNQDICKKERQNKIFYLFLKFYNYKITF